jgi:hypothetical protein
MLALIDHPDPEKNRGALIDVGEQTIVWGCYSSDGAEVEAHGRCTDVSLYIHARFWVKFEVGRDLHLSRKGLRLAALGLLNLDAHI